MVLVHLCPSNKKVEREKQNPTLSLRAKDETMFIYVPNIPLYRQLIKLRSGGHLRPTVDTFLLNTLQSFITIQRELSA